MEDIMSIIKIQNLTKYYGKAMGIENLNLEVDKGEIYGFIGPNGAGKSTTIRTLLSLIYPTSGSASIFGKDVVKHSKEIKKDIGYIPGEVNYYENMTVIELLKYSAALYNINANDRIKELAEVFEVNLKRKIQDLSLGNKKKVSILQSLLHRPKLLILDEPTNGLDPLMQSRFFDVLREENENGTTIFFSSHILTEVQKLCRKVAIIRNGRIIKEEDIKTLRSRQLKKVQIDFANDVNGNVFSIDGVTELEKKNHTYNFLFSGKINNLLRSIVDKDIMNLLIEEPSLEEIFMHYYINETEEV
jgi:ABC-2 type transport system ATP-binding protein